MPLLQPPDLDIRNEELLGAQAIARVSGTRDVARLDSQIEVLRRERELALAGTSLPPLCPELTNSNPSSPHTVLLEVMGWLLGQQARNINQLPVRDQIEFHRLFGIELRDAAKATATLLFTTTPPVDTDVVIPAGTLVKTADGSLIFETDEELIVSYPATEGSVGATCTTGGRVLLSSATLVVLEDPIAFVSAVTNDAPIDSGTDAETVDQALARAVNYQRRGERLVSAADLEDAALEDVMLGSGIVKAFPFVKAGDFSDLTHLHAGHTTLVVMTPTGNAVTDEVKAAIVAAMEQAIGSQLIYVVDPIFVTFSIEADIKVESIAPQLAIVAAVKKNLQGFYATRKGNFGRAILRSEIIAIIEGTPGVDRIVSDDDGPIVGAPAADVTLAPFELPKLVTVTLSVVA
ncbi:MAG TPA: baseplate J/gp47 family protein [Pyrinomonadaceae bacterium]|jgi:uncharacterized phage protein gp47/JayE